MHEADTLLARYRPLFDIAVEHRYFADSYCRGLQWRLHDTAAGLLQRTLCAWRATTHGITMYADVSRTGLLKDLLAETTPPFSFGLSIRASDPLFRHYTDGLGSDPAAVFALDSDKGVREDDGRIRLHTQDCVSADDRATANTGTPRERSTAPRFDIRLAIDVDAFEEAAISPNAAGKHYCLRFAARQTYWQYNVLGDWPPDELGVIDPAERIGFEAHGTRHLANGRIAHTFRSKTAIPLQEQASQRFQLRVQEQGTERVVVKRLPVASAGQFSIEEHAGAPRWVSEIYVHC